MTAYKEFIHTEGNPDYQPYGDPACNKIYNLIFCDDLALYRSSADLPGVQPWKTLFQQPTPMDALQALAFDEHLAPRARLLAYHRLRTEGYPPGGPELLGVVVEVGLDAGLDVLASFADGTARYIHGTGRMVLWETSDDHSAALTEQLFAQSEHIIEQIGPWDQARRPFPANGTTRLSFLVSDGLYFGEAPTQALFNDPMAAPALLTATRLMQYLTGIAKN
ncbi:MAG: hypothetical protein IT266_02750 [Saprospiraceae bacterium]|nr:hypothetical protein [Saprospiraceae bacterium]